jgi:broad specificity phosphatase PhoE
MNKYGQEVFLVRHGETEWTLSGQHTSRTDLPLTDHGREQAQAAARQLAGHEFARVLSSPLQRAVETAQLAGFGDRVQLRDDLREWDYGEYEGLTTPQVRERDPGWSLWHSPSPGGETPEQVAARVDRVIAEARAAAGDVAIFAHGHVLRVLAARWLEQDPRFGERLALQTATVSVLGYEHEASVLWRWNAG